MIIFRQVFSHRTYIESSIKGLIFIENKKY